MELEVSRMILHQKKVERQAFELQYKLSEERRKRKKERKGRKVCTCVFVVLSNGCKVGVAPSFLALTFVGSPTLLLVRLWTVVY